MPVMPLYWAGSTGRNALYQMGTLRAKTLRWPVISVGSLSAGGAGKTPVVRMLAGLLERNGIGVDVLSRGYGRKSDAVEEVDAGGLAVRFGDEPLELARTGLRVFVGADRVAAGELAERRCPTSQKRDVGHPQSVGAKEAVSQEYEMEFARAGWRVHLLDDGFQHRRLGRALDVVLLTEEDVDDRLLPGGNLREPLGSLARAKVVVVRAEEAERLRSVVARSTRAEVWIIRRELVLPERRVRRPVVFCGIARPEGFLRMLREAGCEAAGEVVFRDHQRYGQAEVERIVAAAREVGADGSYTTAKDAVKLAPEWRRRLGEVGPAEVVGLSVVLEDEAKAVATMLRAIRGYG